MADDLRCVGELFEVARDLPADQRDTWVRFQGADERVVAEVLALLNDRSLRAHRAPPLGRVSFMRAPPKM